MCTNDAVDGLKTRPSIFKAISEVAQHTDIKLLALIKGIDFNKIIDIKNIVQDLKDQRSKLIGQYQAQIYDAQLDQIVFKWRAVEVKVFPFSWFAKFQLRSLIKTYQTTEKRQTGLAVAHDLSILQQIQKQQCVFSEYKNQIANQLGEYWQGEESRWQSFEETHRQWQEVQKILTPIITDQVVVLNALEFSQSHPLNEITSAIDQLESSLNQLLNDPALHNDRPMNSYTDVNFDQIVAR